MYHSRFAHSRGKVERVCLLVLWMALMMRWWRTFSTSYVKLHFCTFYRNLMYMTEQIANNFSTIYRSRIMGSLLSVFVTNHFFSIPYILCGTSQKRIIFRKWWMCKYIYHVIQNNLVPTCWYNVQVQYLFDTKLS